MKGIKRKGKKKGGAGGEGGEASQRFLKWATNHPVFNKWLEKQQQSNTKQLCSKHPSGTSPIANLSYRNIAPEEKQCNTVQASSLSVLQCRVYAIV